MFNFILQRLLYVKSEDSVPVARSPGLRKARFLTVALPCPVSLSPLQPPPLAPSRHRLLTCKQLLCAQ